MSKSSSLQCKSLFLDSHFYSIDLCVYHYANVTWFLSTIAFYLQCRRPGFDSWVGKIPWRRKWQSTPALLSGKSHGRRNLIGYSPWVAKSRTWLSDFTFHSFVVSFEITKCESSNFLLFQDYFGYLDLFSFHMNFSIFLSISEKQAARIL